MVTRNIQVRTPRKEKVWASTNGEIVPIQLVASQNQVVLDILAPWFADMGTLLTRGVTAMRIVGQLAAFNNALESVARNHSFFWGIAWLQDRLVTLPAGDSAIPNPARDGVRDIEWIQRGVLIYRTSGTLAVRFGNSQNDSFANLDITQQRKQPTAAHRLALVCKHQSDGGGVSDPALLVNLQVMLALP